MSVLKGILAGLVDALTPDATFTRNRMRVTVDLLLTMGITLLAIVLTVGYQVLGRWGHRFFGDDR